MIQNYKVSLNSERLKSFIHPAGQNQPMNVTKCICFFHGIDKSFFEVADQPQRSFGTVEIFYPADSG
jgi:hypothetical protein